MATIQSQVGPQALQNGATVTNRIDRTAATVATDAHGRYREATYQKNMYSGSIAGQTTTVGLATTYTGLCLSNPVGSNVVLSVNKVGFGFLVVWAAVASVGIMTGYNSSTNVTHTTPVTPRNRYFTGAGGGVGLLDSAATLPTAPTLDQVFAAASTATAAVPPLVQGYFDLEGSLELPPGAYAAFYTSTASGTNSASLSIQWEEIAIQYILAL